MNIKLNKIEMDTSIQCRAAIDTGTVNEYAERMTEGDDFPAVIVYGTQEQCWIADGWHRIMAARQIGALDITAELRHGGRVDALRAALSANSAHGRQRTPADKRRAIEVCVAEFPKLTQSKIAEMVGCTQGYVAKTADQFIPRNKLTLPATRTGSDGKEYPTSKTRRQPAEPPQAAASEPAAADAPDDEPDAPQGQDGGEGEPQDEQPAARPPSNAMQHAADAITALRKIKTTDPAKADAFRTVKKWMKDNA